MNIKHFVNEADNADLGNLTITFTPESAEGNPRGVESTGGRRYGDQPGDADEPCILYRGTYRQKWSGLMQKRKRIRKMR